MDIHCPEISRARGSSPTMLPMLVGRKRTVETSRPLRWSRTSGCGYYKEHIIPVFSRVAPFPRDFPFQIHSHVPTRAVQFTILSIIALGYKSDVTPYVSELSSILLPVSKSATIDKTLFYEFVIISDRKVISSPLLHSLSCLKFIFNHFLTSKILYTSKLGNSYRGVWTALSNPPENWTGII